MGSVDHSTWLMLNCSLREDVFVHKQKEKALFSPLFTVVMAAISY